MVNNPNFYGQSTTGSPNQIEDGVDFPHTGIIKALADGLGQNYAISGFDITPNSASTISVTTGVIFRDGKRHEVAATSSPLTLGRTTANENSYHLLVASNATPPVLQIISPSAKDKVPDYTTGTTIIAVVTHNGSNPMPIQYLTVNKTEHSLSVGRNDSGYREGLTIQTSTSGAIIEAKESNKDIIFKTSAGGTPTEAMRIDGATGNIGIGASTPSSALHVQKDTTGDLVILESFTQDANVAPDIILLRSAGSGASGQGADGDGLGLISFQGRDAVSAFGQNSVYAEIFGNIENATNGAHNGQLRLRIAKGGVLPTAINILSGEVVINEDSYDIDFRVESNGNANMLFVDAGNDRVGIGESSPDTVLHINAPTSPTLRIQEGSEGGYLDIVGYADSQSQIKQVNNTTNESTMLDIDVVSTGTGLQTVRYFRNSNSGGSGSFRIHDPGTTTVSFQITADSGDTQTIGKFKSAAGYTVVVSSGTTLTKTTHAGAYLLCGGNVTLPSTSTAGDHYVVLNTTGSNITIGRNGNNINGAASDITVATYNALSCIAIGSNNWIAIG